MEAAGPVGKVLFTPRVGNSSTLLLLPQAPPPPKRTGSKVVVVALTSLEDLTSLVAFVDCGCGTTTGVRLEAAC